MRLALATMLLVGCSGSATEDDAGTTPPATTWPTPAPEPVDTGWPAGDLGHLMIVHNQNQNRTEAFAIAMESGPGFINLSECAAGDATCLSTLPGDEDEYVDLDTDLEFDCETATTRFLGYEIDYGPYTLPYTEDPESKCGTYMADVSSEDLATGWIGPKWEGQWETYRSNRDLYVSDPVELISPAPDAQIRFTNGEFVPIEWVPNGEGFITLTVSERFGFARLYLLEDDGYFELDVDALGISDLEVDLQFKLSRWNWETIRPYGHVIELVARTDVSWSGKYINIGNREFLYGADRCGETSGLASVQTGGWWGMLAGRGNDLDPSPTCLGGFPMADAWGPDIIHRVEVDPKHMLSVDYNVYDVSASVYLLEDCSDANTCLDGADYDENPNVHEYTSWFNLSDDTETVYIVADATEDTNSIYTMDVSIAELLPPNVFDSCADARASYPNAPGAYYSEFTAYTPVLNPGIGGCTGASAPGPEAIIPIEVPATYTATISVEMPGGDPVLYVLYNCDDAFSCSQGADLSLGPKEVVTHTAGASTETVYVVVDSKSGILPYFFSVSY